jgi:hypothetical protein
MCTSIVRTRRGGGVRAHKQEYTGTDRLDVMRV